MSGKTKTSTTSSSSSGKPIKTTLAHAKLRDRASSHTHKGAAAVTYAESQMESSASKMLQRSVGVSDWNIRGLGTGWFGLELKSLGPGVRGLLPGV
eukprot:1100766-Amorphochlora_amoeboformis.AAC.1